LAAGQWLLVTGAASGVGVAALQTAKALGARVIGTSGSADKLARLEKLGLDVGIRTRAADFHDAVMKATDGKGVNLVVNNVGGSVFAECIKALAFEGRLATVGHLDRVLSAALDLEALHGKRLTVFGVSNRFRTAAQRAETVRGSVRDALPLFADGLLPLHHPVDLAEQLAVLDVVSRGRLDVGIGRGGTLQDYQTFRSERADARQRIEEGIALMQQCWSGQPFDFAGQFHSAERLHVRPRPIQRPHPPLFIAANSEDSVLSAARLGLPTLSSFFVPVPELQRRRQLYRDTARAAG